MLIKLSYNGHYPSKIVEVTDGEYNQIKQIESTGIYLFDSPEGQEIIAELEKRPVVKQSIPIVVVYA
jgi:hypothetical protein